MNTIITQKLTCVELLRVFTCEEEGRNVQPNHEAFGMAESLLPGSGEITWHAPDVFDIRYGSAYVASARRGNHVVRFLCDGLEYKEGDDRGFSAQP